MKRYYFLGGLIILALGLAISALWYGGYLGGNRYLRRLIKSDVALITLYNKARVLEGNISAEPDAAALYMELGLLWKSVAEQSPPDRQQPFFKKSLYAYQTGNSKFGAANILFPYNAGQVAMEMGRYDLAETLFKQVIEISPGDDLGYRALAELYMYKLNKTENEVVAVYDQGITKMYNSTPLIFARASYLRRIGNNVAALKGYEQLSANSPKNAGYKAIVEELRVKIAETK